MIYLEYPGTVWTPACECGEKPTAAGRDMATAAAGTVVLLQTSPTDGDTAGMESHEEIELHALGNAVSTSVIAAENLVR